jgi:D-cysteine desulfhydrase family pyridoxal phosphate-dependent enzyme
MRLASLPRYPLSSLPTPLQRATNLERALGNAPRIYIKRDDLTGLAFGGNKARKLEYLVADALAKQATVLITEGAVQSNHARLTAAAAVRAGLKCVLVLDSRNGEAVAGNLLLDQLMGAEVQIVPDARSRRLEMEKVAKDLAAKGERPYVIPTGGSVPVGAVGYVAMVLELMGQLQEVGEDPRLIYCATGSAGTQAGLEVGAKAFNAPFIVQGIAVDGTASVFAEAVASLANETADLLDLPVEFDKHDICVDDSFIGPGYGKATREGLAAIRLLAQTEAIFLDPVYSGKAMAGMLEHIASGDIRPRDAVNLLHTGGGPSIFPWGSALLGDAS